TASEVRARGPKPQTPPPGIFSAPMRAAPLKTSQGAGVGEGKGRAGAARHEELAGRGAVEDRMARQHVAAAGSIGARRDGDGASGETLADVVVGFAVEPERDVRAQKRAEALAGAAAKLLEDRAFRLVACGPSARQLSAEVCTDAAIGIADGRAVRFWIMCRLLLDRCLAERGVQAGRLLVSDTKRHVGLERESRCFCVIRVARTQAIVSAFEFAKGVGAQIGELLANFFGQG